LAECFGRKLYFDEAEAESIRAWFRENRPGRPMTNNNEQQAWLPEGCTVFHNEWGTAPGCAFCEGGVTVCMLPGPPRECNAMLRACVMPYLAAKSDSHLYTHMFHVFGEGESAVEARLRGRMNRMTNPTLAPYCKDGEVMLRLTAKAGSRAKAEEMMAPAVEEIRRTLGDLIYAVDEADLERAVSRALHAQGKTLAAAESCTGGLLAKRITDVPGASQIFRGGVTVYTNDAKVILAGVEREVLARCGAVSREVAVALAEGVRARLGADLGVGVTGLAGPEGDGSGVPVGTAFVSLADGEHVYTRELHMNHARSVFRTCAVNHALDMVRRRLTGLPVERYGFPE
ncbi:MAG: CinA family nicotinamide mononucleotide deamidase-related protein, partial [Clostridiales bacterium]|nr:CinA family nicotinamide mononucleotide deamidase-related protein [Clostridiales bacterium]